MTRLLALFEYPSINGGEQSFLATLEEVQSAGFRVSAVAPPHGALANRLRQLGIPTHPLTFSTDAGQRRGLVELRKELAAIIQNDSPDLLHANSLSTARLSGPVARQTGVPSIGHLRDIVRLSAAAIEDVNRHTRLLAVSQATRSFHVTAGMSDAKVSVLYNGVDLNVFRARAQSGWLHAELELPCECPLVGSIGQIALRKGYDVLLVAATEVVKAHSKAHFIIVGQRYSRKAESRRFEADLLEAARRQPLAGRVHFLGIREDIPELLPELTLLAHAARQEPLGRVLLEAAACQVPVVATDVGGTQEIFGNDSSAAHVIPAEDVSALAAGITDALANAERSQAMAVCARERVERLFDRRKSADALIRHYHAALAEGRPRETSE